MSSRCRKATRALGAASLLLGASVAGAPRADAQAARREPPALRVCADPNNLPFSNEKQEGLENRLAELVAREMGRHVEYTWWAQRRGFFRETLRARRCDVVLGVPTALDLVLRTRPYYRSSYVFVTRRDGGPRVRSFDDPVLRHVEVGVQLVGDDGANSPPAHALARRGITSNVRGYSVLGDYRQPNPPARIVEAVARGEVDVAVVWGPLAGYFAKRSPVPLRLAPVSPQIDRPYLPFAFDIAMGVRRGDTALRDTLDAILRRRRGEVDRLLAEFGIPRVRPIGNGESGIARAGAARPSRDPRSTYTLGTPRVPTRATPDPRLPTAARHEVHP